MRQSLVLSGLGCHLQHGQLALEGSNARHAGVIVVGVATMIVASTASGNLT